MSTDRKRECRFCGDKITQTKEGDWSDKFGWTVCEIRVPGCGACEDGESHPHEPR